MALGTNEFQRVKALCRLRSLLPFLLHLGGYPGLLDELFFFLCNFAFVLFSVSNSYESADVTSVLPFTNRILWSPVSWWSLIWEENAFVIFVRFGSGYQKKKKFIFSLSTLILSLNVYGRLFLLKYVVDFT